MLKLWMDLSLSVWMDSPLPLSLGILNGSHDRGRDRFWSSWTWMNLSGKVLEHPPGVGSRAHAQLFWERAHLAFGTLASRGLATLETGTGAHVASPYYVWSTHGWGGR